MADKVKPDLRFTLHSESQLSFGEPELRIHVRLEYIDPETGDLRLPQFSNYDDTGAGMYHGFRFDAWMRKDDKDLRWKSWDLSFEDCYQVSESRAESIYKTLKKIRTELIKLDSRLGRTDDFAAFLARLAIVVKCKETQCFGRKSDTAWDLTGYRWMDASDLQYHLHNVVSDWKKEQGIDQS